LLNDSLNEGFETQYTLPFKVTLESCEPKNLSIKQSKFYIHKGLTVGGAVGAWYSFLF
jgi:hypothetical protein